jgi:hypothetical protein
VGSHQQWPIHPGIGISAESGGIFKEHPDIVYLPDVNILLDMVKIVIMPVGSKGVQIGYQYENTNNDDGEKGGVPGVKLFELFDEFRHFNVTP